MKNKRTHILSGIIEEIEKDIKTESLQNELISENNKKIIQPVLNETNGNTIFHRVEQYIKERYSLRNNIISNKIEIKPLKSDQEFTDLNENNLFIELHKANLNIDLNKLLSLLKSDFVEKYNIFEHYFNTLPKWDGKDHIKNLFSHVKTTNQERFINHSKKWIVRAVKCALDDNYHNKQALIFVEPTGQNSGKTWFCRFLCPPFLSNHIKENIRDDKDSRICLSTNLLINLEELAQLGKYELNSLKALFSIERINERLVYDRKNSIIPRRCSFIGSTNEAEFLTDFSGTVRWLCFDILNIDWDYKKNINIDKVWAQAFNLYKDINFKCELTREEVIENEKENEIYKSEPPELEIIKSYFSPGNKENFTDFFTASDFINEIHFYNQHLKVNPNILGKLLVKSGFKKDSKTNENTGYTIKGYFVNRNMKVEKIVKD